MTRLTRCAGWAALVVIAVAAIAVAGCGGGSEGSGFGPSTGNISGSLVHAGSGLGLGGITISAGGVTTTTDASGNFTLSGVPVGQQTVAINPNPDRDLVLPPPADAIVVQVSDGQTSTLPDPVLLIDGPDAPPTPPTT